MLVIQSFLADSDDLFAHATAAQHPVEPLSDREPVKILVVGSREGVLRIIHTLHTRGFADANEWSRLLPTGNAAEVMAILI
jgi:hypothetical protein